MLLQASGLGTFIPQRARPQTERWTFNGLPCLTHALAVVADGGGTRNAAATASHGETGRCHPIVNRSGSNLKVEVAVQASTAREVLHQQDGRTGDQRNVRWVPCGELPPPLRVARVWPIGSRAWSWNGAVCRARCSRRRSRRRGWWAGAPTFWSRPRTRRSSGRWRGMWGRGRRRRCRPPHDEGLRYVWPGAVLAPGLIGGDRAVTGCRLLAGSGTGSLNGCARPGCVTGTGLGGRVLVRGSQASGMSALARMRVSLLTMTMRS